MKTFKKFVLVLMVGWCLLVGLAVAATFWGGLHWTLDPGSVLVIDGETVDLSSSDLGDTLGEVLGASIAALVVLVVVPGSLLIALLATVFGLAVAALSLFGVAAALLAPLLVPVGAVLLFAWLWGRRQRQQALNRERQQALNRDRALAPNRDRALTPEGTGLR